MEQTEIKAVELVRRIRDAHYALLKDKSPDEVIAFYRREAEAVTREVLGVAEPSVPEAEGVRDQILNAADREVSHLNHP